MNLRKRVLLPSTLCPARAADPAMLQAESINPPTVAQTSPAMTESGTA